MKYSSPAALKLLHDGALAFSRIEENGMRVDVDYLKHADKKLEKDIAHLESKLKSSKFFKHWKTKYGHKTNLGSRIQLAGLLFEEMGYESSKRTKTGRHSSDVEALEKVDHPFVRAYTKNEKLKKAKGTFLACIKRELEGDRIHPSFNLNTVISMRGSANDPNSQNFPARDPMLAKLIRTCFIPSKDHVLVEVDLKANEVRVACCYSKDKKLIKDTLEGDMHRDMAAKCFKLPFKEITKGTRHVGKNSFVFPEFYGDFWASVARGMWEAIQKDDLKTVSGVPLYDHLKSVGITHLGDCDPAYEPEDDSFCAHIKQVEEEFWNKRYKGYKQWKIDWWNDFKDTGRIELLTGFVLRWGKVGPPDRKQCVNYPVQGSAFHCLLWAMIKMVKWLLKYKMRSMVIGQIHDSIIADVHKDELDDFLAKIKQLLVVDIRKAFTWLILPLGIEAEMAEENWYEKKEIII